MSIVGVPLYLYECGRCGLAFNSRRKPATAPGCPGCGGMSNPPDPLEPTKGGATFLGVRTVNLDPNPPGLV